jgi:hypothetical protein
LLYNLQNVYELDVFAQTAKQLQENLFEIQGFLSTQQIEEICCAGYDVEIIEDAEKVAKERLKDIGSQKEEEN